MPKSINWPQEFYKEIINEEVKSLKVAIRPGTLYADTNYFRKNDIVDIRVNHKIVRKALIYHDMLVGQINELPENITDLFKAEYKSQKLIAEFLKKTYNKHVDENTMVTIIPYLNLPLQKEVNVDDPHL
ncbi:MAG: hypothetical protein PHV68_07630 [Candidatus Gastranaerophilales bacterium]|nr:hypothetical protein [Candidatus Gastranaerophilales bacterium]